VPSDFFFPSGQKGIKNGTGRSPSLPEKCDEGSFSGEALMGVRSMVWGKDAQKSPSLVPDQCQTTIGGARPSHERSC